MHIKTRNVHDALPRVLDALSGAGVRSESRNGPVIRFQEPVIIEYERPLERVMFWPERDANPFFHLVESLWMLAGRNDVASMKWFASNMGNFSDDGLSFHGAYGNRWRGHFSMDQLNDIVRVLKSNPEDRRCVLQMWDAESDLAADGKDFPCNVMATFEVVKGVAVDTLNMSVFNRSNDIVWGALGANAVHFSVLQEYMAAAIGVRVGRYYQISSNLHAYEDTLAQVESLAGAVSNPSSSNPYHLLRSDSEKYTMVPLVEHSDSFDTELGWFWDYFDDYLEESYSVKLERSALDTNLVFPVTHEGLTAAESATKELDNEFFGKVAVPMVEAYAVYKTLRGEMRYIDALGKMEDVEDDAWRIAGSDWLNRRLEKFRRAKDDGVQHA